MKPRKRWTLAFEIALVLAIKLCLLYFIWLAWFSEPTAPDMEMDPDRVADKLLSRPPDPLPDK